MGGSTTQHTLHRGYAGRRPPGTAARHDAGGECSVAPPEWTEIRLCVAHVLVAGWREGCARHSCHHGQSAGVVRRLPYVQVLATAHVV